MGVGTLGDPQRLVAYPPSQLVRMEDQLRRMNALLVRIGDWPESIPATETYPALWDPEYPPNPGAYPHR